MGTVIALMLVWFVVSVPVSLMFGAFFASSQYAASEAVRYPELILNESPELEPISIS